MSLYLRELRKIPLLTPEEERDCARAAAAGDAAARERLIRANLRFVVAVARQHARGGASLEDLVNEGNIGLMKAAARFDPERGVRFISYAVWWVRQSMRRSLPGRPEEATVSLDSPTPGREDESPLWASMEDSSMPRPEETLLGNDLKKGIDTALHVLPRREREILRSRYGLSGDRPMALGELGERCRLSRERIRQIEKRAMSRLRAKGGAETLRAYTN
jgi:RNA polymerase primary sigma factor